MPSIVRPMNDSDLQRVWLWRNSDRVRESSFNNNLISYEEHIYWWNNQQHDPQSEILIFEWNDFPVGVVSFKYDESFKHATWSFYIGEPIEKGLGYKMARQALEYVFFNREVESVTGLIIELNKKSEQFHIDLGFLLEKEYQKDYERGGVKYDIREYRIDNWLVSSSYKSLSSQYGIEITPLKDTDVDKEYISWYQNDDGHLNYFTGSRRAFTKATIVDDMERGLSIQRWFYYLIKSDNGEKIGNFKVGLIDQVNFTSDLVCLIGNREFAGKGLAKKSIEIANQIAFNNHGMRRLQGGMYEDHIASFKAYTRAGWFEETRMNGYYWVNGKPMDRICVACLNPKYFPNDVVEDSNEH
ncbi:GNAT family N-acetyltransferase [Bermanella sp. R86510]|uniref:GNAT family N-acetyltransferase n=1 Tax=unclassified Bermanella TaxID=2627862 RepID=UPI0037C71382